MATVDPRILRGMEAQLASRRERLSAGERPIGWKVGLSTREVMDRLGTGRPLVGFLTDARVLESGATAEIAGWANPRLEPEVAVHLAADVAPGAGHDDVRAAIGGMGPAIELVDIDPPPDDVAATIADDVFHRHVILGAPEEGRRSADGVSVRVTLNGADAAATDDPQALTGELVEVVRLTAELLEACGERLRAGEVVITGSAVPAVAIAPGDEVTVEVAPLGALAVRLA